MGARSFGRPPVSHASRSPRPASTSLFTIVSAPAGYGKTTAVCQWLELNDHLCAWFSLDEEDNDLRGFLAFLIGAVRTIYPDALNKTRQLLETPALPPLRVLVSSFSNELENCPKRFSG